MSSFSISRSFSRRTAAQRSGRVVSSPRHTKRLLNALQKNLERYEERYGRIELGPDEDPAFH